MKSLIKQHKSVKYTLKCHNQVLFVNIIALHLLERLLYGPMFTAIWTAHNSDYQNVSFNSDFSPKHSVITTCLQATTYLTYYCSLSEQCILNTLHRFRESQEETWLTALQSRSQSSAQSETKCLTCPSLSRPQKLSRTTWPEKHRLRIIMRPRD